MAKPISVPSRAASGTATRTATSFLTIACFFLLAIIVAAGVASKDPAFMHWMQTYHTPKA